MWAKLRRPLRVGATLGALVLGMYGYLTVVEWPPGHLNSDNLRLVKPGMSRKEVEQLVGGPPGDYRRRNRGGGVGMTTIGVRTPPGTISSVTWIDDDRFHEVFLDGSDRVTLVWSREYTHTPTSWPLRLIGRIAHYVR